ncbi:hypothetical protein [Acinetobacter baumannii]|uniref:hypothetical protein n=2 Tax=Acinetobacter baumannii TaxID=470 RepID=UPI002707E039|nr:hypothetical protein [Acinetobacter baumannii]
MCSVNKDKYSNIMEEIVNDIFYSNVSYRGKIAIARQLAEIILRIILDYPAQTNLMLGDKRKVIPLIKSKDLKNKTGDFLYKTVDELRQLGNMKTHTKELNVTTKEELDQFLDILYRLMAYLFIDYFCSKNKFSDNPDVGLFSVLPPIIRFITLEKLSEIYPDNVFIWYKLGLVTLKKSNIDIAIEWVEENKDFFENMSTNHPDLNDYNKDNFPNMYLLLIKSIKDVKNKRDLAIYPIYETFEESVKFYKKLPSIPKAQVQIPLAPEMKSLLDFLFYGH